MKLSMKIWIVFAAVICCTLLIGDREEVIKLDPPSSCKLMGSIPSSDNMVEPSRSKIAGSGGV